MQPFANIREIQEWAKFNAALLIHHRGKRFYQYRAVVVLLRVGESPDEDVVDGCRPMWIDAFGCVLAYETARKKWGRLFGWEEYPV
jgi:hypothetical protein